MKTLTYQCPGCGQYHTAEYDSQKIGPEEVEGRKCPSFEIRNEEDAFDFCPICSCRQFYLTKDFNRFLGCMVMLVGIVLVPFTFGLSLPVVALVDWLMYRRVKTVVNCYRCGCEFRGFDDQHKRFKPFMHHIGLKYDKYR